MLYAGKHLTDLDDRSAEAAAYRKLYNTARWRKIRAAQLSLEPTCRSCAQRNVTTVATVCNHLRPETKATAFFAGPYSSLCAPCHDSGMQKEERAGYSGACDATGWPTDDRHPANQVSR